jgi:endoglucanase
LNNTIGVHFKWMQDWGFDFVRIPVSYPYYLNIDRTRNITAEETYQVDEKRLAEIDNLVQLALKYNLHVNFNLHRAPGYCISSGFHEPFNLWKDKAAQDAFYYHWDLWAKRYKNVSTKNLSFDLVNEPVLREDVNSDSTKVSTIPGDVYRNIAKKATEIIHQHTPGRLVIADGNNGGSTASPELVGLPLHQSCRGYYPFSISHYKAPWVYAEGTPMPAPQWPAQENNQTINRAALEQYYKPWLALMSKGVGVHCGECGGWKKTPHTVFLAWFEDLLSVLSQYRIGFSLWNFIGEFGLLNSGRTDVTYENWFGYQLDRKLLKLLQKY